ncbi:MAG TPA: hypothetical protein PKW35_04445 [Nannocystaceae bacterium]|nr:hypothetical protein [Nannocystaceae bacterium]
MRAFYDQRIGQLIGEDAPAMRRSPLLREIFTRDFLEGLGPAALPGPAAFAVYMMWRFGVIYGL